MSDPKKIYLYQKLTHEIDNDGKVEETNTDMTETDPLRTDARQSQMNMQKEDQPEETSIAGAISDVPSQDAEQEVKIEPSSQDSQTDWRNFLKVNEEDLEQFGDCFECNEHDKITRKIPSSYDYGPAYYMAAVEIFYFFRDWFEEERENQDVPVEGVKSLWNEYLSMENHAKIVREILDEIPRKRSVYVILIKSQHENIRINGTERKLQQHKADEYILRMLHQAGNITIEVKDASITISMKDLEEWDEDKKENDFEVYVSRMDIYCKFVEEKSCCDAYLSWPEKPPNGEDDHEWQRGGTWLWKQKGQTSDYIWEHRGFERMQIYYDKFSRVVYCIDEDVAIEEKTFGGMDEDENENTAVNMLQYLETNFWGSKQLYQNIFDHQNITQQLWMADRYHFMKNTLLYGQDNEFNIFRSFCFVEGIDTNITDFEHFLYAAFSEVAIRVSIGLLCLILQLLLTVGIVIDVIDNWDIQEKFDSDLIIITIAFVVFSFISYTTLWTIIKFFEFYEEATYVFKISPLIILLDFVSNVIIGLIICLTSFFYLLQSESISDVVLNSFALTFILELDDLANLFESDEDVLLKTDWGKITGWHDYPDYNHATKRREVKIPYIIIAISTLYVILSPLFIIACIFWTFVGGCLLYSDTKDAREIDILRTKRRNKNKKD